MGPLPARGYRVTPQVPLVLEAVARLGTNPEDVGAEVRQAACGSLNISTITAR